MSLLYCYKDSVWQCAWMILKIPYRVINFSLFMAHLSCLYFCLLQTGHVSRELMVCSVNRHLVTLQCILHCISFANCLFYSVIPTISSFLFQIPQLLRHKGAGTGHALCGGTGF